MFLRRNQAPTVDIFTTGDALQEFAERQAAVTHTAHTLGIDRNNAVLIGGAGLAVHGIDTYIHTGNESFDLDAFVDNHTFAYLQDAEGSKSLPAHAPSEVHLPNTATTLPVSGLRTPLSDEFSFVYHARTFQDLVGRSVSAGDLLTLKPAELASAKLQKGRVKDLAGILKAHVVARAVEHPIADDQVWQWRVVGACNSAVRRADRNRAVRRAMPSWLGQLISSDFDHPAFHSLNPSLDALHVG